MVPIENVLCSRTYGGLSAQRCDEDVPVSHRHLLWGDNGPHTQLQQWHEAIYHNLDNKENQWDTIYPLFFFLRTIIQNETSLHAQKGTWGCFIRAKLSALCIVATQNTLRKSPWCSLVETDCSRRKCYAWDLTETNLPPLLLPFPLSL